MSKIRVTITRVYEYEPALKDYGTNDINEALQMDLEDIKKNPEEFMNFMWGFWTKSKVTGKVID